MISRASRTWDVGRAPAAVTALVAAAGASAVLAWRADGWALAYDLDARVAGRAAAPWLALALSAVAALAGFGPRGSSPISERVRGPLRAAVVLATTWSVALLPLDALRAVRLIPLGVSGWGVSLRVLLLVSAAGALVATRPAAPGPRCTACGRRPSTAARLPRWPAWVALVAAVPYPALRTVWALGGTFATVGEPLDVAPVVAWGVVVAGAILVAVAVVLLADRGPAWLRTLLGLGAVGVGGALGVLGAQASVEVWTRVAGDGAASLDGGAGLTWWAFALVYACWAVGGPAIAVAGARFWARRRPCPVCPAGARVRPSASSAFRAW